MENFESKIKEYNIQETGHKSRCTECPSYKKCMGTWLDYFAGKELNKEI